MPAAFFACGITWASRETAVNNFREDPRSRDFFFDFDRSFARLTLICRVHRTACEFFFALSRVLGITTERDCLTGADFVAGKFLRVPDEFNRLCTLCDLPPDLDLFLVYSTLEHSVLRTFRG